MTLIVDMEKLLKFCPFKDATACVSYSKYEISIAFEWRRGDGQHMRLVKYLSVIELNNSVTGIDGALTSRLHQMRQEMELARNIDQPV